MMFFELHRRNNIRVNKLDVLIRHATLELTELQFRGSKPFAKIFVLEFKLSPVTAPPGTAFRPPTTKVRSYRNKKACEK